MGFKINKFKIVFLLLFALALASSAFAATNVSILYGWNGTEFVPLEVDASGSLKTTINLTESVGLTPRDDNAYDIGTTTLRWATIYTYNIVALGNINVSTLNVTSTTENATFEGDVLIKGTLYGPSPVKVDGLNVTGGNLFLAAGNTITFADGTTQSSAGETSGSGNSTAWNRTGTNVILSGIGDFVGIGTSSPAVKLVVIGNVNISDSLNVSNTIQATTFIGDGSLLTGISSVTPPWNSSGTNVYLNDSSAKVGIGTSAPTEKLVIIGNLSINNTAGTGNILFVDSTSGNVSIGSTIINDKGVIFPAINKILNSTVGVEDVKIYNVEADPYPNWFDKTSTKKSRLMAIVTVNSSTESNITIYDLTDPATPILQNFTLKENVTSIDAGMGYLVIGSNAGVRIYDWHQNSFGERINYSTSTSPALNGNSVNDISIGYSLNAPKDPVTGGPKLSFAVSYRAGSKIFSIITDSGQIYETAFGSAPGTNAYGVIDNGIAYTQRDSSDDIQAYRLSDFTADSPSRLDEFSDSSAFPRKLAGQGPVKVHDNLLVQGGAGGLTLLKLSPDYDIPYNDGMVTHINKSTNTGWQVGNISGAWLANSSTADRSYRGNTLTENGAVTEEAVATGSELNIYTDFSDTNYLSRAHDTDFDFRTEFSVMGWFKSSGTTATEYFFTRKDPADAERHFRVSMLASGKLDSVINDAGGAEDIQILGTQVLDDGEWHHVVLLRDGDNGDLYVDGVLDVHDTGIGTTDTHVDSDAVIRLGNSVSGTGGADTSSLALWRLSATAPTASQIRYIYETEKRLFEENAKAFLQGSGNTVQAVDIDTVTNEVYVGQADSLQIFDGLVMEEEKLAANNAWTSDNIKAISAHGKNFVIATASEVYASKQSVNIRETLTKLETNKNNFDDLTVKGVLSASKIGGIYDEPFVTIDPEGNVGIGTTQPNKLLELSYTIGTEITPTGLLSLEGRDDGGSDIGPVAGPAIEFRIPSTTTTTKAGALIAGVKGSTTDANDRTFLVFHTTDTGESLSASTERMRIEDDGGIFMYGLVETGDIDAICMDTNEELTKEVDSVCDTSALRFKKDIRNLTYGIDEVMQMRPIIYRYKEEFKPTFQMERTGFIAEELELIIPEVITYETYGEDGKTTGLIEGIDYPKFTAVLVGAIQEQQEQIETQQTQIQLLSNQNQQLNQRIEKLELKR